MTPRAQAEAHPTPDEMRLSEAHDAWVAWDVPECVMKTPYQVLKTAFTHGYLAATRPAVDARSARLAAEQLVQKWQRVDGWGQEELIDAIAAALSSAEARYREVLAQEREECAKLAEDRNIVGYVSDYGCWACFKQIAAAIRARGK